MQRMFAKIIETVTKPDADAPAGDGRFHRRCDGIAQRVHGTFLYTMSGGVLLFGLWAGLTQVDQVWVQTWMHRYADLINHEGTYPFLMAAKRAVTQTGRLDIGRVEPDKRFLVVRAKPDHPDAWLTNRLISDFVRFDFVSRYVFNKQGFYDDYSGFSDIWREAVVETLKSTYLKDKAGFRLSLYGLKD